MHLTQLTEDGKVIVMLLNDGIRKKVEGTSGVPPAKEGELTSKPVVEAVTGKEMGSSPSKNKNGEREPTSPVSNRAPLPKEEEDDDVTIITSEEPGQAETLRKLLTVPIEVPILSVRNMDNQLVQVESMLEMNRKERVVLTSLRRDLKVKLDIALALNNARGDMGNGPNDNYPKTMTPTVTATGAATTRQRGRPIKVITAPPAINQKVQFAPAGMRLHPRPQTGIRSGPGVQWLPPPPLQSNPNQNLRDKGSWPQMPWPSGSGSNLDRQYSVILDDLVKISENLNGNLYNSASAPAPRSPSSILKPSLSPIAPRTPPATTTTTQTIFKSPTSPAPRPAKRRVEMDPNVNPLSLSVSSSLGGGTLSLSASPSSVTSPNSSKKPRQHNMSPSTPVARRNGNVTMTSTSTHDSSSNSDGGSNSSDVHICEKCWRNEASFICAGCSVKWYCSRECQAGDWEEYADACA